MKLLLIDPTCVYPAEKAKVAAFQRITGISLQVLTGNVHRDEARRVKMSAVGAAEDALIHAGKTHGKFPNRTFMSSGLIRCLKQHPDVILAYSDWDHLLTLEIALSKAILSPHSKLIVQGWENRMRSWKSYPQANALLYAFDTLVEKIVFRAADAAVVRSPEAAHVLEQRGFSKPIRLIPWGIDTDLFTPRTWIPKEEFTVGYAGRLIADKGVDDLIKALQGLDGVKGLIVGRGPEEKTLRNLARELGIPVTFSPAVDQDKLPDLYAEMDLFVLPSRTTGRWAEQFGRAAVEAMAVGRPVIGSSSGAIPWVIGDAELIYPEGNIEALRNLIVKLKSDRHHLAEKSLVLQQRAREQFNWDVHAQATVKFCREVGA